MRKRNSNVSNGCGSVGPRAGFPSPLCALPTPTPSDGFPTRCQFQLHLRGAVEQGKPVFVPDDGENPWTLTATTDFALGLAGLVGKPEAVGRYSTSPAMRCDVEQDLRRDRGRAGCGVAGNRQDPDRLHLRSRAPNDRSAQGRQVESGYFRQFKNQAVGPGIQERDTVCCGHSRISGVAA